LRHGHAIPQTNNLYVTKVGEIACAIYRRRGANAAGLRRGARWITYPEEQADLVSARWIEQQLRSTGGKVALRASNLTMRIEAMEPLSAGASPDGGGLASPVGFYRFLEGPADFSVLFTNLVQRAIANPAKGCESG